MKLHDLLSVNLARYALVIWGQNNFSIMSSEDISRI